MLDPDLNPLENRGYGPHPPGISGLRAAFCTSGAVGSDAGTETVLIVPTANYDAPASFTCTVSDGRPAPASAKVLRTMNALAPVARNHSGFITARAS